MQKEEKGWGLVFSGGGAKGSYEIGVFKALRELGFEQNISAVSGASVGALNAALFATGDYENAEKIWKEVKHIQFLDLNSQELEAQSFPVTDMLHELLESVKKSGICSREGLLEIMQSKVDFPALLNSRYRIYAGCSYEHRGHHQVEYFLLNGKTREEIMEILLASSAMPFVYEPVKINGILYQDGGVVDNTPVYPLVRDGYEKLIVVKLEEKGYVEKSLYENREVIEIIPSRDLGDFFDGTIDFSHRDIIERMQLGYYDARTALKKYCKKREEKSWNLTGNRKPLC